MCPNWTQGGHSVKKVVLGICAFLLCLNISACNSTQTNPSGSNMETTASPLSDVYPTEIKAIMSTAQELNAQVFEPDFSYSNNLLYRFEGAVSGFGIDESDGIPFFMVETEFGPVCVKNPVVQNEDIDPDIRSQYEVSDRLTFAEFYADYAGYDEKNGYPYFILGDAWYLGYCMRETAIEKKDIQTLTANFTPDVFPSFALDIYPEDTPEAPQNIYLANTDADNLKNNIYTLTGVVSNNRMKQADALTQVRTATITTLDGDAVLIDQTGEFYGAPLRSMYMPPKNNTFVKAYVQYLGYSEEHGKALFAIDSSIAKEKITDRRSSINSENLNLLTKSDYDKIEVGMTLQQVEDTLNCRGIRSSSYENALGEAEIYEWPKDRGSIISVIFVNGTVSSKSQIGF